MMTAAAIYPMIFNLGFWEIAIIVLIILLLFGAKRIPDLMKGLGKGVSSFKEGIKGDEKKDQESAGGPSGKEDEK